MRAAPLLALIAACATPPARAPVVPAPAPVAAPLPDGRAAIDDAIAAYGRLARYRDTATIVERYDDHGKRVESTRSLATTFVRDRHLAFAVRAETTAASLWADATHAYLQVPGQTQVDDHGSKRLRALAVMAGVSRATSLIVPALLLGGRSVLAGIEQPRTLAREPIDGRATLHVHGAFDGDVDVWLDATTALVRRIAWRQRLPGVGDVVTTVDYRATPDAAIADAELAAPTYAAPVHVVPTPSWIGITFDLDEAHAARIKSVLPDAPAARAGLRAGDTIGAIDGVAIADAHEASVRLHNASPGVALRLAITRAGAPVVIAVTPESQPDPDELLQRALVGKPATDVDDLRGHVVVLDFWATWCKPCQVTMPRLAALADKYRGQGLRVVGYSSEAEAVIAAYRAKHAVTYPLVRDADDAIAGRYLVQGIPELVIIDRAGVVRDVVIGADDLASLDARIRKFL